MNYLPTFARWTNPKLAEHARVLANLRNHLQGERYRLDPPLAAHLRTLGLVPAPDKAGLEHCIETLQSLQQALAIRELRNSMALDPLLHPGDEAIILATARAAYQAPVPSLMDELLGPLVDTAPASWRLKYPWLILCAALETPQAREFGLDLLTALDWYGQQPGETASELITGKLIFKALALDLDPHKNAQGFDFDQPRLRGKSMRGMRVAINAHVRDRRAVSLRPAAPFLLTLISAHLPAEFQVHDVPQQMAWRRSNTWVHFSQGVRLAELVTPGSAPALSFDVLCTYASRLLENAGNEVDATRALCATTLTVPLLHWGISNKVLPEQPLDTFSQEDVASMFDLFAQEEHLYAKAVEAINTPAPERLQMARDELTRRAIPLTTKFVKAPQLPIHDSFWAKGQHQLAQRIPAVDVLAGNAARSVPPTHIPEYLLDRDLVFRPQNLNLDNLPDIPEAFGTRFLFWMADRQRACRDMITALLRDLPEETQLPLRSGTLSFHLIRQFDPAHKPLGTDVVSQVTLTYQEIIDRLAPQRSTHGFIIEADHEGRRLYYEVLPYCALIRPREDLVDLPTYSPISTVAANANFTLNIDANAYITGAPPKASSSKGVLLETVLGPLAATDVGFETRVGTIAREMTTQLFSATYVERVRKAMYGTTYFDQSPTREIAQAIIPFWGPVEDLREGLRTGDRETLKWAIIGLPIDAISVLLPAAKLGALTLRSARMAGTLSIQGKLVLLRQVARQYLKEAIALVNPLEILKTIKGLSVAVWRNSKKLLMRGLRQARRSKEALARPIRPLQQLGGQLAAPLASNQRLVRVDDGRQLILHLSDIRPRQGQHYLIDPISTHPCGRALRRLNNRGSLSVKPAPAIDLDYDSEAAGWLMRETTPNLRKQWVTWGEDQYLKAGNVLYKRVPLPDGNAELRRIHSAALNRTQARLKPATCRPRRGLDPLPCGTKVLKNLDHSETSAATSTGDDIVPWFNDRIIWNTSDGRFVHNHFLMQRNADPHPSILRNIGRRDYVDTVEATIVGGNDRFKQLDIRSAIVEGVPDMRRVSAVIAKRREDGALIMVARLDDQAYYKGTYTPGSGKIQLNRITNNPPPDYPATSVTPGKPNTQGEPKLSENDALQYIYNGSVDAHLYFQNLDPVTATSNLKRMAAQLTPDNKEWLKRFIGGPFDLGTSPEQAALFCRYSQDHMLLKLSGPSSTWGRITKATDHSLRKEVAGHLEALHGNKGVFSAETLTNPNTTELMASDTKNIAFARVTFNDPDRPAEVYYSLSGVAKADKDVELTRMVRDRALPAQWTLDSGVPVAPDRTRYINSQFKRPANADNPGAEYLVFLPDHTSSHSLTRPPTQQRMLDSERMILRELYKGVPKLSVVDDILVFSKYPTCQSCTLGLASLRNKLPGKVTILEGARRESAN